MNDIDNGNETDTNTESDNKSEYEMLLEKYNNREKEFEKKFMRLQREYKRDIDIVFQKIEDMNKVIECITNSNNIIKKYKSEKDSQLKTPYNQTDLILDYSLLNNDEYYDINNIQYFYQLTHLTIRNYRKKPNKQDGDIFELMLLKSETLETLLFDNCTLYSNNDFRFIKQLPELKTIEFNSVRFYFDDELKIFHKNPFEKKKPIFQIFGYHIENNDIYFKHPKISHIILDKCTKIKTNLLYNYCKNNKIRLNVIDTVPSPTIITNKHI